MLSPIASRLQRTSKLSVVMLISFGIFFSFGPASESKASAQAVSTCLEIRAQYPNGVAKSKKVRGFKLFPKAKIDLQVYEKNRHLDFYGNNNGVLCDKKENFISIRSGISFVNVDDNGVEVSIHIVCGVRNVKLDYGFVVGFAELVVDLSCDTTARSNDSLYSSYYLYDYYDRFALVYDDLLTDEDGQSREKAVIYTDLPRFSDPVIKPKGYRSARTDGSKSIVGTRSEIESLYLRIKNGLKPISYLGVDSGRSQGCFTESPYPPYEVTKISESSLCEYTEEDSSGFTIWRDVWDLPIG